LLLEETETMSRISTLKILSLCCVLMAGLLVALPSVAQADVTLSVDSVSKTEDLESNGSGANAVLVTIRMSGDPLTAGQSVTANLGFDGEAVRDTDYSCSAESVTFNQGDPTTKEITVSFTNEAIVEADETIEVYVETAVATGITATADTTPRIITIQNDDTVGVTLSAPADADEGDADKTENYTVSLSGPIADDATVQVTYSVDSATTTAEAADYDNASGTVDLTNAASSQAIAVTIHGDLMVETDEDLSLKVDSVAVTAGGLDSGDFTLPTDPATHKILNDDIAVLTLSLINPDPLVSNEINEGTSATLRIESDHPIQGDLQFALDYGVPASATYAASSEDYSGPPSVLLSENDLESEFNVTAETDGIVEPKQEFQVALGTATLPTGIDPAYVTVDATPVPITIVSEDTTTVYISSWQTDALEDNNPRDYIVTLSPNQIEADISVAYAASNGSASVEEDLVTPTSGIIPLAALESSATFTQTPKADSYVEGDETFTVALGTLTADSNIADFITINSDTRETTIHESVMAEISLAAEADSIKEDPSDPHLNFTINLSRFVLGSESIQVAYRTEETGTGPGHATSGSDFDAVDATHTFSGGGAQTPTGDYPSFTFPVQVNNDPNPEDPETFRLVVEALTPSNSTVTVGVATVTILDNDYTLTIEETADGTITPDKTPYFEEGDDIQFVLGWQYAYQDFNITGTHGAVTETIADPNALNGSGSVTVANVTSNLTVKPIFKHQIVYTIGANGELDLPDGTTNVQTSGDIIVDHGVDATFSNIEGLRTDTPIRQYCVSDVVADGSSVGSPDSYTFPSVEESHNLEVTFRENTVTVTIMPAEVAGAADEELRGQWQVLDENGDVVDFAGWRNSGDTVRMECQVQDYTVHFKPVPGWKTPPDIVFTIDETTTGPQSFTGEYTQEYYELRVDASHLDGGDLSGSSISIDPPGVDGGSAGGYQIYIYGSGTDVELTANPPDGSMFHQWQGAVTSTNNYITVTMDSDKVLTAVYKFPSADNDRDGYYPDSSPYDCNDNDAAIHPGALEICGDGVDQDCDGSDEPCGDEYDDNDNDGYSPSQGDCDDDDPNVHPGAYDDPSNEIDEDCYGGPREPQYMEYNCVEPAEVPLESQVEAAPPMIMFLYDDSGSMNWEFITDEDNGTFNNNYTVFPTYQDGYSSDNLYGSYYDLQGEERQLWRSQWNGYNRLYFNPGVDYKPWPRWHTIAGQANANADPDRPRLNPMRSAIWPLDLTYFSVRGDTGSTVPAQYVQITSQQNYRYTLADEVRLVPTFSGTTLRVDDNGTNFEQGYFDPLDFGSQTYTDYDAFNNSAHWQYYSGRSARWYFYPPQSGDYRVYAWVPSLYNLPSDVDYTIAHNSSSATVTRSQSANYSDYYDKDDDDYANDWMYLGTYTFAQSEPNMFIIPMAHYFTHNDEDGDGIVDNGEVYLVALDGALTIYRFTDADGNNRVDNDELSLMTDADIDTAESSAAASGASPNIRPRDAEGNLMAYAAVRQNFANWFSFYRRRELTAKAAIGRVIESLHQSRDRAQVGLAVLNDGGTDNHEVMLIDANDASDQTQTVLANLYNIHIEMDGTPLRRALQDVGQYFDRHDDGGDEYLSTTPPWADEAAGGGCQRAFAIVMTDGYYNGSDYSIEGDLRTMNADGDGRARNPVTPDVYNIPSLYDMGVFLGPNNAYDDPTLADIAMFYYENDLDASLSNNVQPYHYDIAPHQHMVTYSVAFGVHGAFDPEDPAYDCLPQCDPEDEDCPEAICPEWQRPLDDGQRKIDDLYHAAINGRGQFYAADDPQQLVDSLEAVMKSITGSTATGSAVSINAQELQSDTALYQATYLPSDWSGDVMSKPLDPDTGLVIKDQLADGSYEDRVNWSAMEQLDSRTAARKIITYNDYLRTGVTFQYGSLSDAQKLLLDANDTMAQKLVAFLRGDTSEDGGLFRDRSHILGDVVHASPIGYRWSSDPGVVFVGANDGMLHVLDEETGEEIFAYVPNLVFANLKHLADEPYVHHYYVDNEPSISKLGSSGSTLLLGGLGRGGRGYYCLDISTIGTSGFDAEGSVGSIVKWEWPANSDPENAAYDPDMGYSFGQGFIVNTNAGNVAIFPNGYDSENGRAVLFAWPLSSSGTPLTIEPIRIDTGVGANNTGADGIAYTSDDDCNGLSTPALVDDNLDGLVDTAYAGDLLGNLWKFDLSSSQVSEWDVAYKDTDGNSKPLFQARNLSGFRQPITVAPDVMSHCDFNRRGNIVVFGTGRYIGMDDYATYASVETIYGIWDWADEWENLSPVVYSDEVRDPETKYMGYFNQNRQLSNLVSNPILPGTDQIVYTLDLTASDLGDQVTINGTTFTHAPLTDKENHEYLAASGLAKCINDLTYGLSGVTAEAAENKVVLRSMPAGDTISISPNNVNGTITVASEDLKASLLQQVVIYSDDKYIVVSDNPIEWFNPNNGTGRHVGWYLDLPGSSERLVNDPMIRGGYVYAVPTIPSESPCKAGGDSIVYGLNACNGGQSYSALFNINGDERVNNADLINIGTPENPIWVAPTGLKKSGLWYSPAVLGIEGTATDRLYFSTSDANVETEQTAGEKLGFLYWRTW